MACVYVLIDKRACVCGMYICICESVRVRDMCVYGMCICICESVRVLDICVCVWHVYMYT